MTDLRKIVADGLNRNSGGFINPLLTGTERNFFDILKWKLASRNEYRDLYRYERVRSVKIDFKAIEGKGGLSVTFVKHASIFINDGDASILVDPVFFFLPGVRNFTPLAFRPSEFPVPDYVLITHDHFDHLSLRTLKLFKEKSRLITPLGYNSLIKGYQKRHEEFDWFDSYNDGKREIISVPSNHWCFRNPIRGRNSSLWCSYLIKTSGSQNIFIAGDTAYHDYFADIGKEFKIDLAVFNLGAYEPEWFMNPAHINPRDTVKAFQELGANRLMIVHWGSFRLGDDPVWLPPVDIALNMKKAGLSEKLVHLEHGETLFL
jgi:L-ascorbate metabolism protein UlaG (beta-lactamase superfamily)